MNNPETCKKYDPFWGKVKKTDQCWIWTGFRNKTGYGKTNAKGKTVRVHRYSWTLKYGEIPKGMSVCHKCDNPPCVNPDHLFLGTHTDNMRDAYRKGRISHTVGEDNPTAKMTNEKVLLARKMHSEGRSGVDLAKIFGVGSPTMYAILNRRSWKHV